MAAGEKKVSAMTYLESVPDTAKIYIVVPGNTTPYYTTKAALMAGISGGTTPNLQQVTDQSNETTNPIYSAGWILKAAGVEYIGIGNPVDDRYGFYTADGNNNIADIDLANPSVPIFRFANDKLEITPVNFYYNGVQVATIDDIPTASDFIDDIITDGVTNKAPSQNAVFDALALKENSSNKGVANGYASLNSSGVVPSSQLPSYVDDVLEYANLSSLPATGEAGKIYITIDTNLEYRWSGSTYVNIAKGDVQSVNTKTGAITLNTDDIGESGTPTNKWFTDTRARAAVFVDSFFGSFINGLTAKTTPANTDLISISDSEDSNKSKKVTFTNFKAFLKTYFDTLYQSSLTAAVFGSFSSGLSAKNTLVDADSVNSSDSAASGDAKKTTWLNVWTNYIKPKADLNYLKIIDKVASPSGIVTGTTTETQVYSKTIAANTFSSNDLLVIRDLFITKTAGTSAVTVRVKLSTSSTMPSGTTDQIAVLSIASSNVYSKLRRSFNITGGNILGFNFTSSSTADDGLNTATSIGSAAFNPAVTQYLYVSITLGNSGDSATFNSIKVTN